MAWFKSAWTMFPAIKRSVNTAQYNELNKIITQLPQNSNALVSQISRIHSAAFRDGPILRINSSKHCIKELNPAHEYCLPTFTYISVRHKGKKGRWAVGPTKNPSGRPPGKSRGLKVYDGQRVPTGTVLVNQMRPVIFPGWNVSQIIAL